MPMLMTTCQKIIAATPTQTVAPKRSRASPAIFRIQRIRTSTPTTAPAQPTNPHSSAHTANGKSVQCSGKCRSRFWVPCRYPLPENRPDPIALSACRACQPPFGVGVEERLDPLALILVQQVLVDRERRDRRQPRDAASVFSLQPRGHHHADEDQQQQEGGAEIGLLRDQQRRHADDRTGMARWRQVRPSTPASR